MRDETELLRQIHPIFVQAGNVTSQAFRPTPKDKNQLSVYDGSMIDPAAAWRHYTASLLLQSDGVLAVTFTECKQLQLNVTADSATFREQCLVSFEGKTRPEIERISKQLRNHAVNRGRKFRPRRA